MKIQKQSNSTISVSALLRGLSIFFLMIGMHSTSVAQELLIYGASHIGPEGDSVLHRLDPLTGAMGSAVVILHLSAISQMDLI